MKRESSAGKRIERLRPTIVGTGLVALDVVVNFASPNPKAQYFAGGTCGNVLTVLSFLGWDSKPIARLKNDVSSKLLIDDLAIWGVDQRYISRSDDGSTPVIIQNVRELKDGTRTHSFSLRCPCCSAYLPGYKAIVGKAADAISADLPTHQVFFLDRVSRGTLNVAKASAKKGAVVVFEPTGIGEPRLFREAWSIANIVKYSNERLRDIADLNLQPSDNSNLMLEIETFGEEGLRYRSQIGSESRGWKTLKSIKVAEFRDAAGSGDWLTAGIIQKLAKGGVKGLTRVTPKQLIDSLRYGQALATWNCSFDGARGGMYQLTRTQIDRQIKKLLLGKTIHHKEESVDAKVNDLSRLCPTCESLSFPSNKTKVGA